MDQSPLGCTRWGAYRGRIPLLPLWMRAVPPDESIPVREQAPQQTPSEALSVTKPTSLQKTPSLHRYARRCMRNVSDTPSASKLPRPLSLYMCAVVSRFVRDMNFRLHAAVCIGLHNLPERPLMPGVARGRRPTAEAERRAEAEKQAGDRDPERHAASDEEVIFPPPAEHWDDLVVDAYVSAQKSGQRQFYEPSDVVVLRYGCEAMHRSLHGAGTRSGTGMSPMLVREVVNIFGLLLFHRGRSAATQDRVRTWHEGDSLTPSSSSRSTGDKCPASERLMSASRALPEHLIPRRGQDMSPTGLRRPRYATRL